MWWQGYDTLLENLSSVPHLKSWVVHQIIKTHCIFYNRHLSPPGIFGPRDQYSARSHDVWGFEAFPFAGPPSRNQNSHLAADCWLRLYQSRILQSWKASRTPRLGPDPALHLQFYIESIMNKPNIHRQDIRYQVYQNFDKYDQVATVENPENTLNILKTCHSLHDEG